MTKDEATEKFGFDPETIGNRFRSWHIVADIDDEEEQGNAQIGYLCVRSRDGASNPMCMDSIQKPNCVGTAEDGLDHTYRYYYFKPLS